MNRSVCIFWLVWVGCVLPDMPGVDASPDAGSQGVADGGVGCQDPANENSLYVWKLPPGFPEPSVPADNPMSEAKVQLGRHLFYDTRLSFNQTQSCASCHHQERAFTDGREVSRGSTGEHTPRNAMSLANVAYVATLTWANPLLLLLEQQGAVPLFGREPVELGMNGQEDLLLERLRQVPRYQALFPLAFPKDAQPLSVQSVLYALSAFQRTLISGHSAYDRYVAGDRTALSEDAQRGRELFHSEKLECFHCHNGFNLMDTVFYACKSSRETRFHNTGLYNIPGPNSYPAPNTGIHAITGRAADMGKFRAQSLRNVAVTAPYMHDGSIATLSEVLDHYAAGGRTVASGPFAGDGSKNPQKSSLIIGFQLSAQERADVLAFLESLTDEQFLTNEAFSDPWPRPCPLCE